MKRIAICGDSFLDEYIFGDVERISPEAPVPVVDVTHKEVRGGGAINVANNLNALGIEPVLFSITNMKLPYEVRSPKDCTVLKKTRFIGNNFQLLRVDEPKRYSEDDINKMVYPSFKEFDIIAFADYNKGLIKGGRASIVDSKKKDLTVFKGTEILKVNQKEWDQARGRDNFPYAFVTCGKKGIDFYQWGIFRKNEPTSAKEVIDVTGAGDTVMAVVIYCLVNKITDTVKIMQLANKAAGIKVSKFGTAVVTKEELGICIT